MITIEIPEEQVPALISLLNFQQDMLQSELYYKKQLLATLTNATDKKEVKEKKIKKPIK